MDYFLIEGGENYGKTTIIIGLDKVFQSRSNKWEEVFDDKRLKNSDDIRRVLEKDGIRVLINSRSDADSSIRACKSLCDRFAREGRPIDLLISSCRTDNDLLRKNFFKILGISEKSQTAKYKLVKYSLKKRDDFDDLSVTKQNEYNDKIIKNICVRLKKEFKIELK